MVALYPDGWRAMKNLSPSLSSHLQQEVTTLATCWRITRRDSVVLGFTDHDRNIIVGGDTYLAASGFTPTAISSSSALNVDNLDVEGMLDSSAIDEADLMAGLYDFAEISIFQVNYNAPADGQLLLRTGWLGEVAIREGRFIAEVRGLTQRLGHTIGELYSPSCRATFGDARCKKSLAPLTVTGTVDSSSSRNQFQDVARAEAAGIFSFGKVTFTSGDNTGLSMEVKEYTPGKVTLVLPMPYEIAAGDHYSLVQGCDKTFDTCAVRFENAVNFRGEPHVPGLDRMLETAATRSEW